MAHGYHHGDLREALIRSAMRALDREGALPSWRALARACRVTQTAPYRHFESLEALEAAVIEACFRRLCQHLARALRGTADPHARLGAAIRAYLRFARLHPNWYGLMFGRIVDLGRYPSAVAAGKEAFAVLRRQAEACGVSDPGGVAFILWSAHHGMADLFRRGLRPGVNAPERALVDGLVEMSLAYARKQGGA